MMRTSVERAKFRRMVRGCAGLAFVIALIASVAIARADGAILYVGKIQPRQRAVITRAVEGAARQLGWSLAERTFEPRTAEDIVACLKLDRPGTCLSRPLLASGIEQLAVIEVGTERGEDGDAMVVVTQQVIAPGAEVVFVGRRVCERCDDAALSQHVTQLTTKLIQEAASGTNKTALAIRSVPQGAWITLDGESAGATNATVATFPGVHTVMLRAHGYETEVRDVTAVEGRTTELAVTMRPSQQGAVTPGRVARPSRTVPFLTLGLGGALLIAGGVMVAIDEDPSLVGERFYLDTAPAGVATLVGGAIVSGVGAYLLVRRPKQRAVPTASITPNGGTVGWIGRF